MNAPYQTSSAFQDEKPNFTPPDGTILSITPNQHRTRIPQFRSDWMRALETRFNELTALPIGWDGYSGQPVSFTCANFAANLIERLSITDLPAPQLVPGNDGSLQIEWHRNGYDIEIDVLAPLDVVATRYDHTSSEEEELELQSDFTPLAKWIEDLMSNREQATIAEA